MAQNLQKINYEFLIPICKQYFAPCGSAQKITSNGPKNAPKMTQIAHFGQQIQSGPKNGLAKNLKKIK